MCVNAGTVLNANVLSAHDVVRHYVKHQRSEARPVDGQLDIGAYEFGSGTPVPADLVITTTSLANGTVGTNYLATVSATGGVTPYTWSIASGTLPPGLALNPSTGVISGTPTTRGPWSFTVRVQDSQSPPAIDTQPLSITVAR